MSAMFTSSGVMMGMIIGEIGWVPWLLSCGVHVAGENENSDDCDDVSVKSSNSAVGEFFFLCRECKMILVVLNLFVVC